MKKTKIIIVTSGQPCGNPRMVKEAQCLSKEKMDVTVVYCPLSPWGDEFDNIIKKANPQIKWLRVGAHPSENPFKYILVRIRKKIWGIIYRFFGNHFHAALKSSALYSQELKKEAHKYKSDLFIGHNLGAIHAITHSAQKHNAKAYFDFEDFHRGEDLETSLHWKRSAEIENEFVHRLNGATAASDLITAYYKNIFPTLELKTILNVFPKKELNNFIESESELLKLFWFSQTIGFGRGLEYVLRACAKVIPQPRITLLGNCSAEVKDKMLKLVKEVGLAKNNLIFQSAVHEAQIPIIASSHHIGLCTEDPMTLNRQICLTNKIFTYMQGKNALLLSNTKAQRRFLEKHIGLGKLIDLYNIDEIVESLQYYQDNRKVLDEHRIESLRLANERYNWEKESEKLLKHYKESVFS